MAARKLSQPSAESVASILESSELASKSSSKSRPTPGAGESSSDIGLTSPVQTTYAMSLAGNDQQVEEEEAPPLKAIAAYGGQSISSSAGAPAKTSPSPEDDGGSPAAAPASSMNSPASPMSLFGPQDGFYSRTSLDSSPAVPASDAVGAGSFYDSIAEDGLRWAAAPDEMIAIACLLAARPSALMEPSLLGAVRVAAALRPDAFSMSTTAPSSRWSAASSATSGFTTSPGESWIAATSECPSDGGASSSLPDVLEADVPPRFFLSPRAAAGILRRAKARGRALPSSLMEALSRLSTGAGEGPMTTRPRPGTSSPIPSEQGDSTPQKMGPEEPPSFLSENQRGELRETPYARQLTGGGGKPGQGYPAIRSGSAVRRLTPTECERLQGLPDSWTVPTGPSLAPSTRGRTGLATQPAETPSPPTSRNGSGDGSSTTSKAALK
jgi:hypothetical protein